MTTYLSVSAGQASDMQASDMQTLQMEVRKHGIKSSLLVNANK
jgi:hypothetical protein